VFLSRTRVFSYPLFKHDNKQSTEKSFHHGPSKIILGPMAVLLRHYAFIPIFALLVSCQSSTPPSLPPQEKRPSQKRKLSIPATHSSYLGLSKATALAKAKAEGRPARIIQEDHQRFMVTKDYRPNRLNFIVKQGIITGISKG